VIKLFIWTILWIYIYVFNLYLLSIQNTPFIIVTMLTHYKCYENFTPELNIYRGWTVYVCVLN
jgi:hypothetical protein